MVFRASRDISNHSLTARAWFKTIVTCYAVLELSDRTFNLTSSVAVELTVYVLLLYTGPAAAAACTSGCGRHDVNTMSVEAEDSFEHTSHIHTHRDVVCRSPPTTRDLRTSDSGSRTPDPGRTSTQTSQLYLYINELR